MSVQTGRTMPKPPRAVAMPTPWRVPFARALRIAARVAVMVATLGLSALAGVRAAAASPSAPPEGRVAIR